MVKICWFNLWRWQPMFWPADFWIKDNWLPIPWASHCLEFRYILKRVVFLSFTPLQTVHPHPKPIQSINPQSFQFLDSDFWFRYVFREISCKYDYVHHHLCSHLHVHVLLEHTMQNCSTTLAGLLQTKIKQSTNRL